MESVVWDAQEQVIQTPCQRFAAKAWGPSGGSPVLALHGWLDNAASFDGLAPLLTGCRVLALDMAGHGFSDWRPPRMHYHFVDYVEDVVGVADAMGWKRFHLLGHSLGAAVASFVAAVIPQCIGRVGLIEALGPLSGAPENGPMIHAQAIHQMTQLRSKRLPSYSDLDSAARAREAAGDLSLAAARALCARGTRSVDGRLRWRSDPRLTFRSPYYFSEPQIEAYLRAIESPVMLVLAERGVSARRGDLSSRLAAVRQLQVARLPGGHHLHMDNPDEVATELSQFLSVESIS